MRFFSDDTPLASADAGERATFLKAWVQLGIPLIIILLGAQLSFLTSSVWEAIGWLIVDLGLSYWGARLIHGAGGATAAGLAQMVYAGGNLSRGPTYSAEETLVIRGKYTEAIAAYELHRSRAPDDVEALIRIAEIHRLNLCDLAAAEYLLLQARRLNPDARQQMVISNSLVEIYTTSGRRDRLQVELARFADLHRNTRAGAEASRALKEMKGEQGVKSKE